MAAGKGGALAVWEDERQCCGVLVYAARVDPEGRPLDPIGFSLGEGSYGADPQVVWDGSQYIVVWDGYASQGARDEIYAARVAPDGEVLDEPPIVVVSSKDQQIVADPVVDSTGRGSLVAWTECRIEGDRCSRDVAGAVIDKEGGIDPLGELVGGPGSQSTPGVVAGPDGYLLSWTGGRDARFEVMALDESGGSVGEPQLLVEGALYQGLGVLRAAYSDGRFLFGWQEERGSTDDDVWGKRVMPSGVVLDQEAFIIGSRTGFDHVTDVTAAPDGGWIVTWGSIDVIEELFISTVDPEGEVSDTSGSVLIDRRGHERDAGLSFIADRPLLVWYSTDERLHSVAANSVDQLQGADAWLVSQAWNEQREAVAAWNGEVFLVVWVDERGDPRSQNVFASRVAPSGETMDGAGLSVFADRHGWITPAVASNGRDFLIVWAYARRGINRDIYAARVTAEGELLDSVPIVVSRARKTKAEPTVVWTGTNYLVAWEDYRNSARHAGRVDGDRGSNSDIYGARVASSGDLLDPVDVRVVGGKRNELTPQLVVSSDGVALAWSRDCGYGASSSCTHDVFAARLRADGRRTKPVLALGTRSGHETMPDITSTPDGYLVAWTDWRRRSSSLQLRAITKDWDMQATRTLDYGDEFQYSPHLAWAGEYPLLSWINGSPCIRCGGDVALLRLSADGEPVGEPTAVATDELYESVTDLGSDGSACAAVVYEREDAEPGVTRSFLRLLGEC